MRKMYLHMQYILILLTGEYNMRKLNCSLPRVSQIEENMLSAHQNLTHQQVPKENLHFWC